MKADNTGRIPALLDQLGITYVKVREDLWQSALRVTLPSKEAVTFPLLILLFEDDFGDRYLRLTLCPYFDSAPLTREDLSAELARMNDRMMQVKFALDDENTWQMTLDTLEAEMDASRFEQAARRLALYAGAAWAELHSAEPAH